MSPAVLYWLFVLPAITPEAIGDSLLLHGYYQEAAFEFQRQLAEFGSSDSSGLAIRYLKLGLALGAAGELPAALGPLRQVNTLNPEMGGDAQMALAGFYALNRSFSLSRLELSEVLLATQDSGFRAELYSKLGWLALQEGEIGAAAACYESAGRNDVAADVPKIGRSGMKNENLALVFSSVLPGAGEAYAGRPIPGILSLLVTGACLGGVVLAARSDDWVTASILFTALFWRFYNGSRWNAVDFSREFNQRRLRTRREQLSARYRLEPDWFRGVRPVVGPDFPRTVPDRRGSGRVR